MDITKIHEYTDIYLEAYLRAMEKTHNPDLSVQIAVGVTSALTLVLQNQEPKKPEPQQQPINPAAALFAAMFQGAMNQGADPNGSNESDNDE